MISKSRPYKEILSFAPSLKKKNIYKKKKANGQAT